MNQVRQIIRTNRAKRGTHKSAQGVLEVLRRQALGLPSVHTFADHPLRARRDFLNCPVKHDLRYHLVVRRHLRRGSHMRSSMFSFILFADADDLLESHASGESRRGSLILKLSIIF